MSRVPPPSLPANIPLLSSTQLSSLDRTGSFQTHIYIPLSQNFSSSLQNAILKLDEALTDHKIVDVKMIDDLHISLTATFILKHHQISLFIKQLESAVKHIHPFAMQTEQRANSSNYNDNDNAKLIVLRNASGTRSFLCLQLKPCPQFINLVEKICEVVGAFCQTGDILAEHKAITNVSLLSPGPVPSSDQNQGTELIPHVSLLSWKYDDNDNDNNSDNDNDNSNSNSKTVEMYELEKSVQIGMTKVLVDKIACKIGNNVRNIHLTPLFP